MEAKIKGKKGYKKYQIFFGDKRHLKDAFDWYNIFWEHSGEKTQGHFGPTVFFHAFSKYSLRG